MLLWTRGVSGVSKPREDKIRATGAFVRWVAGGMFRSLKEFDSHRGRRRILPWGCQSKESQGSGDCGVLPRWLTQEENPNVNKKCVHGHQKRREARVGCRCYIDGRTEI